jgi:hypothetical protein
LTLYNGYGRIESQLVYQYGINMYDSKAEMEHEIKKNITNENRESILGNKRPKAVDSIIVLDDNLFREFI